MEVAHEAVVDPKPAVVTEGVAVGLLDGGAGGGADVGEEQRRLDVALLGMWDFTLIRSSLTLARKPAFSLCRNTLKMSCRRSKP